MKRFSNAYMYTLCDCATVCCVAALASFGLFFYLALDSNSYKVNLSIETHTRTHTHVRTHTHAHMHKRRHTHICTYAHIRIKIIYAYIYIYNYISLRYISLSFSRLKCTQRPFCLKPGTLSIALLLLISFLYPVYFK